MESVKFRPERPTKFLIVPRDSSQPVQTVDAPALFNFHFANGFEDENGDIVFGEYIALLDLNYVVLFVYLFHEFASLIFVLLPYSLHIYSSYFYL